MAVYIRRGLSSPTNDCIKQTTPPEELMTGPACERVTSGNSAPDLSGTGTADGYSADGYVNFSSEGLHPSAGTFIPCPQGNEIQGYHRTTPNELFSGQSVDGRCVSPYYRLGVPRGTTDANGNTTGGGISQTIINREAQLLTATGKPVQLLRRQFNGAVCPCVSINRGRAKKKCHMCFGTGFVPGYIPYHYDREPLGRIFVRFEPYTEDNPQKEQGIFQDVQINAWTLSFPEIRKRDVLIVYNVDDGTEEFRYEVINVTRNAVFGGIAGAQKFLIRRVDPTDIIYSYDPLAIPDLADIRVDLSDVGPLYSDRGYDTLGIEGDGVFADAIIEPIFGDGAFSYMFTEGYKQGYEVNFKRTLNFQQPMFTPDFNEDDITDDGYGPIFYASNGKHIRFPTPQQIPQNIGISALEIVTAEQKKNFVEGWISGAKDGILDGTNELRARGLLT